MSRSESVKKYNKENTQSYKFALNKKTDKDLIDWIDRQENKTGALKDLMRFAIMEKGVTDINLITFPWVQVFTGTERKEVSLLDAIIHAQDFEALDGMDVAENFSVLRVLVAAVQAIYFPDGADEKKWRELSRLGYFPAEPAYKYFDRWRDRFFLLGDGRRFLQSRAGMAGTGYKVSKMTTFDSGNKPQLFAQRSGIYKDAISFGEAARRLCYTLFFDDASNKKTDSKLPSISVSVCGQFSNVYAQGENLFETILYNAIQTGSCPNIPLWEQEERNGERVLVPYPDNEAGRLTFPSRNIWLDDNGMRITGYHLIGGDYTNDQKDSFCARLEDGSVILPNASHYDDQELLLENSRILKWLQSEGITGFWMRYVNVLYDNHKSKVSDIIGGNIKEF